MTDTKTFTVELTSDEVNAVAYALKELANKKEEQGKVWHKPNLHNEVAHYRQLAERVYQSLSSLTPIHHPQTEND